MPKSDLPDSIVDPLNEILEIIDRSTFSAFDRFRLSESANSAVAIFGPRGSGKTTLLAAACRRLDSERRGLVLPILQPEIFESTDSLMLACLLNLEDMLGQFEGDPSDGGPDAATAIARAIRAVAASSGGAYQALLESRESAGQYSIDAASILRHRALIPSLMTDAFRAVTTLFGLPASSPTIIPIDDADLSPQNLASVITAVRTLGTLPGVIPIITSDQRHLELAVAADLMDQYKGGIDLEAARALSRQILAKMIRPERTVSPAWLTYEQKERFVPIGADGVGLSAQLAGVKGSKMSSSMGESMWSSTPRTAPLEPMSINSWLPETPRQLERLWHAARDNRLNASVDPTRRAQRLQRFVEALIQSTDQFSLHLEPARASVDASGKSLELVWPNLQYGISSRGAFVRVDTAPGIRLRVRSVARFTGALFPDSSTQDGVRGQVRLTNASISCVQAVQQLAISGILGGTRDAGPTYIGPKEFEFLQSLKINGVDTDDLFFSMPDSVGVSTMTRAAVAWNQLVEFARAGRFASETETAAFIRKYVQLVSEYWAGGRESMLTMARPPSLARALDQAASRYLSIDHADRISHQSDYTAEKSYCHWFEVTLPQIFHASLLGDDSCRASIASWLNSVSSVGRGGEAVEQLRTHMTVRLEKMIEGQRTRKDDSNSWIYGYRELANVIDAGLFADVLLFEAGFKERRRSSAAGHEMLVGHVELAHAKGAYEFQPHATAEGNSELKILRDVLKQIAGR